MSRSSAPFVLGAFEREAVHHARLDDARMQGQQNELASRLSPASSAASIRRFDRERKLDRVGPGEGLSPNHAIATISAAGR